MVDFGTPERRLTATRISREAFAEGRNPVQAVNEWAQAVEANEARVAAEALAAHRRTELDETAQEANLELAVGDLARAAQQAAEDAARHALQNPQTPEERAYVNGYQAALKDEAVDNPHRTHAELRAAWTAGYKAGSQASAQAWLDRRKAA